MSRSNPTDNSPNPCTRWFEWDGSNGSVRYYDKEEQKNINVGDDFTFILLDQLGTIKGWDDSTESSIYSNEIKDSRAESFVVKAFKRKGIIAEGFWKDIGDRVKAAGGHFTANLYIAFKESKDKPLALGSIQFKGAALNAWVDFAKAFRKDLYTKSVHIKGSTAGKKGQITFKTQKFHIKDISEKSDKEATELDVELQAFLKSYFARTRVDQVEPAAHPEDEPQDDPRRTYQETNTDDDIPF